MKLLSKIFALTLVMIWSVSCDFLDVVPDERTTDTDTYAGRNNSIRIISILAMLIYLIRPTRREVSTCLRETK